MKIIVEKPLPTWLWAMIHNVHRKYIESLKNKILYRAKLENLIIKVELVDDRTTEGYCGCMAMSDLITITLYVNLKDSKKFIAFVIAHELTHFLFVNPFDMYGLSGKANDGSTNLTAVQRIDKDGEYCAYYLEEFIVDYIAKLFMRKLDYDDLNGQYAQMVHDTIDEQEMIYRLESTFGTSLQTSSFIDCVAVSDSQERKSNYFWDSIMSFSFNNIIDIYDAVMGEEAFRKLCDKIDKYGDAKFGDDKNDDYVTSTVLMNEIKSEIALFCKQVM